MPCSFCGRVLDCFYEGFVSLDFGVMRLKNPQDESSAMDSVAMELEEEHDLMTYLSVTASWDDETYCKPGKGQYASSVDFSIPHASQMNLLFCSMGCFCGWCHQQRRKLETPPKSRPPVDQSFE